MGGATCMKLDMKSQAFDVIKRPFPFRALKFFQFSKKWINGLIKDLITT